MLGSGSSSTKSGKIRRLVKNGLQAWYKADETQAPLGEEEIANGDFSVGPDLVGGGLPTFFSDANMFSHASGLTTVLGEGVRYRSLLSEGLLENEKTYKVTIDIVTLAGTDPKVYFGGTQSVIVAAGLNVKYITTQADGAVGDGWIGFNDAEGTVFRSYTVEQVNPNDSWTRQTGWTVKDSFAEYTDGSGTVYIKTTDDVLTNGKKYKLSFNIPNNTAYIGLFSNNGSTSILNYTSYTSGDHTLNFTSTVDGHLAIFSSDNAASDFTITNISLKEITNSVRDCSKNNNNAVLYSGKCLDFDGTGDYVSIPDSPELDFGTGDFTLAAWINCDNLGSLSSILDKRDGTSGWSLVKLSSNQLALKVDDTGGEGALTYDFGSGSAILADTWYRVVVSADRDKAPRLYINGEFISRETRDSTASHTWSSASNSPLDSTSALAIGAVPADGSDEWDGMMADVQIYKKAWGESDVAYDWENPDKDVFDNAGAEQILGPELSKDINTTNWESYSYPANAIIGDGVITWDGGQSGFASTRLIGAENYNSLILGSEYLVSFDCTRDAGTLQWKGNGDQGAGAGVNVSADGSYESTIIASDDDWYVTANADFIGTISNISVKKVVQSAGVQPTDCKALYRLNEGAGSRVYNAAPVLGAEMWDGANGDITHWQVFGDDSDPVVYNTVAEDSGAVKITYVSSSSGGYIMLREAKDLKANLVVGETYEISFSTKVNQGSITWRCLTSGGGINATATAITSTSFETRTMTVVADDETNLYIHSHGMTTGDIVWIKDISVKEISLSNSHAYIGDPEWVTAQPYIPQYAMSSYSKKMIFDGSDDYVALGSEKTIAADEAFSFSFWYYNTVEGGDQPILGKTGSASDYLTLNYGDEGIVFRADSGTAKELDFDSGSELIAGKLNHIVLTSPGGTGTMKCYLNGVVQADTETSPNAAFDYQHIFKSDTNHGEEFIDELAHFSTELSATEVSELFNSGMALDCRDHSAYLGGELVTDGGFANGTASWSENSNWTYNAGGSASSDGTTPVDTSINQSGVMVVGKTYVVSFEITSFTSGTGCKIRAGSGTTYSDAVTTVGVHSFTQTCATNDAIYVKSDNSICTIDNVSVKEVDLKGYWRNNGTDEWTDLSEYGNNGTVTNTNLLTLRSITSNFDSDLAGWTEKNSCDTYERSTTQKVSGTHSLHIVENSSNNCGARTSDLLTGTEGLVELTVTAKVYPVGITSIETGIDNTTRQFYEPYTGLTAGEWNDISYTCTVTTNEDNYLYFLCPGTVGEFYLDDVSVVTKPITIQLQEVPYFKKDTFGLPMNRVRQRGLNLDGDSYVEVTDDDSLGTLANGFTCSYWYRHSEDIGDSGSSTYPYIYTVTKGTGLGTSVDGGFGSSVFSNRIYADLNTSDSRHSKSFAVASGLGAPVWYYVTAVYNKPEDDFRLYINADRKHPNEDVTGTFSATAEAHPLRIGTNFGGGFKSRSVIDDVKWYNRALSQAEITKNYKATKSRHSSTSSWSDDFSSDFI